MRVKMPKRFGVSILAVQRMLTLLRAKTIYRNSNKSKED